MTETTEKFAPMTDKQRNKFIQYLLTRFEKRFSEISGYADFFNGVKNTLDYGMHTFTRTDKNTVILKSDFFNGEDVSEDNSKSNLLDILILPD